MPSSRPRLFDDVSRLAGDAASAIGGLRSEVETAVRQRIERVLADLDMVPRDEFDAVRDMAAAARDEQERLTARIVELEAKVAALAAAPKPHAATAARRPPRKSETARPRKSAAKPAPTAPDGETPQE